MVVDVELAVQLVPHLKARPHCKHAWAGYKGPLFPASSAVADVLGNAQQECAYCGMRPKLIVTCEVSCCKPSQQPASHATNRSTQPTTRRMQLEVIGGDGQIIERQAYSVSLLDAVLQPLQAEQGQWQGRRWVKGRGFGCHALRNRWFGCRPGSCSAQPCPVPAHLDIPFGQCWVGVAWVGGPVARRQPLLHRLQAGHEASMAIQ